MPFQPFMMGNAAITIDGDAFEGEISSAIFTPSSSTVSWRPIGGGQSYTFTVPATWVLDLTLAQDWAEADSLARFLHDREGDSVVAVFEPIDGGPSVTATISVTPGAIGAGMDAVAESTVSMGSTKPVLAVGA